MTGADESRVPSSAVGAVHPYGSPARYTPPLVAYLPVAWLGVVVLLTLRGLVNAFPFLFDHTLPTHIGNFIFANAVAGLAVLLWGLYLVGLAITRSPRFPHRFVPWQISVLAWTVAGAAYVLFVSDFILDLRGLLFSAFEVAMGLICLRIVRRPAETVTPQVLADSAGPSTLMYIVAGVLGLLLGGAAGFGGGLLLGAGIAEITNMSCFEGACGYFALFIGLAGLVIGAIAGAILAVWLSRRQNSLAPTAS